jgi:hypothetical protein
MKTYNFTLTEQEAKTVLDVLRCAVATHPDTETARERQFQIEQAASFIDAEMRTADANMRNPLADVAHLRMSVWALQAQVAELNKQTANRFFQIQNLERRNADLTFHVRGLQNQLRSR